jgi:hypothetical protein
MNKRMVRHPFFIDEIGHLIEMNKSVNVKRR